MRNARGHNRSRRRQSARDPLPGVVGTLSRTGADPQLCPYRGRKRPCRNRSARCYRGRRHHPGGAVESGGEHRRHPGHPRDPRRAAVGGCARRRLLADHRRKTVARHGSRMPVGDRRGVHRRGGRPALRRACGHRHPGLLVGPRGRPRRHRRCGGALDTAADDGSESDGRDGERRRGARGRRGVSEHGTASAVQILPVTGLPEFRPGDDLATAIAGAAPWLRDGDVVVVTSKVVSKCEGRLVPAPNDPEARDALRRKLVDAEAVRVLARKGRTLITENRLGLVQAAAGVDGSNVDSAELALLPTNPDGSAATLRTRLRELLGVTVAVVVTDTMGRAWRNGQTDVAVGSAGLEVLHGYAGAVDAHGNELIVTEVAVADEIAAAADLVKGKLTGIPVAVVRGLPVSDDGSTARHLIRAGTDDLFWLGTAEALELGRQQ